MARIKLNKRDIHIALPQPMLKRLQQIAADEQTSVTEIVIAACRAFIAENECRVDDDVRFE